VEFIASYRYKFTEKKNKKTRCQLDKGLSLLSNWQV